MTAVLLLLPLAIALLIGMAIGVVTTRNEQAALREIAQRRKLMNIRIIGSGPLPRP